ITNQHVILRQLTTMPGDRFDRKDLFESQSSLARLGFFDPNTINVLPVPDPANNTVDLVYHVDEQPNDKYEFTGTFNGAIGFTGGVGLELNNFASKDFFRFKKWKTFPRGDGERLSLRYNTAGKSYNSFNFNYSNPWLNTEKQTSFFINSNISRLVRAQTDEAGVTSDGVLSIKGISAGISKRLNWPDPFFSWTRSLSLTNYRFDNYDNSLAVKEGHTNLFTFNNVLSRNTINHPFYPSVGSQITANLSVTPPYSLFLDESDESNPYRFGEYAKLMIDVAGYKRIAGKLVWKTGAHFGILDNYSKDIPLGPFERFHLGGTGLNGQDIFRGNDLIGLRGYRAEALVPVDAVTGLTGGTIYQKFNVELRHPVVLSQSYSAYIYAFAEAGNTWSNKKDYKPFDLYKSAGVGMRFNLPFVGQFGLDWAYGFDQLPGKTRPSGSQFHFTIGMPIR
ncbi:MAG: BamA/TamA family outer membrane protein, partial [Cyclobacteriaceae bacterium]